MVVEKQLLMYHLLLVHGGCVHLHVLLRRLLGGLIKGLTLRYLVLDIGGTHHRSCDGTILLHITSLILETCLDILRNKTLLKSLMRHRPLCKVAMHFRALHGTWRDQWVGLHR